MHPYKTVYLIPGHMGNKDKPFELGAKAYGFYEAKQALLYAVMAYGLFIENGIESHIISYGTNKSKISQANNCPNPQTSLLIHCHLNSGGGNYPLVMHNNDALQQTRLFANILAENTHKIFKGIINNYKMPDSSFAIDGVRELNSDDRGYVCLNGTRMSSVLYEPLFIDNKKHLPFISEPYFIARTIYKSVLEFNEKATK